MREKQPSGAWAVAALLGGAFWLSGCDRQPNVHERVLEEPEYVDPPPRKVDTAGQPGHERYLPPTPEN